MNCDHFPVNFSKRNLSKRPQIKATILDKKGKILAIGYNSYEKTSPIQAEFSRRVNQPGRIYLHAEISALIKIRHGIPYKIIIERYDSTGNPKTAAPCPICALAIREAGIERIEYTVG